MIVYSEEKFDNQSVFIKHIIDDKGNEINKRCVRVPLKQIQSNSNLYFILYTSQMEVISDAFEFLNFELSDSPINTRYKTAYALRLLYCYLELSNSEINKLTEENLKELQFFLRGIGTQVGSYSLKTQRCPNTINGYFASYRRYFISREINCDALFRAKSIFNMSNLGNDYTLKTERKRYLNNLRGSSEMTKVPKYISPEEFRKIFKLTLVNKDLLSKIILHLMYGYGLRLGEVLGLTIEDVTEKKINNKLVPLLILRNRITDKSFQFSKGLPHVSRSNQYRSKSYISSKTEIIISYSLYDELIELIDKTHQFALSHYSDNYKKSIADIVSNFNKLVNNHYIFLNQYGSVLSDQTWNNHLKKYFKLTGLQLDIGVREYNLSHRFRHGFAMFHARFSERRLNILELQKMLRHRNITSTLVYYNPTDEDEFQIKTSFQNELYALIPELKKRSNDE